MLQATNHTPGITVAICTYNRSRHLIDTLADLERQTADRTLFDVLVVNNNCTDNTAEILSKQSFAAWVVETSQGLSFARNRALRESCRTYTLFIDDDVFLPTNYIHNWLQFLNRYPDVNAAGAPISVHFDDGKPRWFPMVLAQMLGRHPSYKDGYRYPEGAFPHGGNMLVHTETAIKSGAFHTGIGRTGNNLSAGEEKDFFRRMQAAGHAILHNPRSPLKHRVGSERLTPDYIARQARGIGHGDGLVLRSPEQRRKWHWVQFIKTVVSIGVGLGYLLAFQPGRARTVLQFRREVIRGFREAVLQSLTVPGKHSGDDLPRNDGGRP